MSEFYFDGFVPSNTTAVPDDFFDKLLPFLNEAQLKVLLYIIRRTLGFKKSEDYISLKQFRFGIKTKGPDGKDKQLDYGCGLKSMNAIAKAARDLERMGCIDRVKSKAKAGDDNTTCYKIRFRSVIVDAQGRGGTTPNILPPTTRNEGGTSPSIVRYYAGNSTGTIPEIVPVLSETYPQETVIQLDSIQETVLQDTYGRDNARPTPAALISLYKDFLFLDDYDQPTILSVILTPQEFESEIEDDRRGFAAGDVKTALARLGHTVAFRWIREKKTPTIIEAAPDPAPQTPASAPAVGDPAPQDDTRKRAARTRKKAGEGQAAIAEGDQAQEGGQAAQEPPKRGRKRAASNPDLLADASEGAKAVVAEWLAIFKEPRPITQTLIARAEEIAAYHPKPGQVAACRLWQYANDTKGWYKQRGHDLGDVARDFGKFLSLQDIPAPGSGGGQDQAASSSADNDQAAQDQAAREEEQRAKALAILERSKLARAAKGKATPAAAR